MNRKEILAKVGRALNKSDTLDARTQARLLDHLNRRHREIVSAPGCAALRRREFEFASIAGQARYAINHGEAIKHVIDLTNDRELSQRSLGVYREFNPDPSIHQGTPDGFVPIGFQPVALQPVDVSATPGVLNVVSTNAADTTQTVYVETTYGTSSVMLNGLVPVVIAGPVFWVEKFYLSAPAVGHVVLTATNPPNKELARLVNETYGHFLAFFLDPTPSAVLTYKVDAEFVVQDLANDQDEPYLPSDFHDVLELGTVMDELHHLDDSRTLLFQQRYAKRLGQLQLRLARQGMDTGPRGRSSRLGPWAPSTGW